MNTRAVPLSGKPRLRLRVTAAAESALRAGHPWVFDQSIRDQNREGIPGELAVIFDRRDRFLALGLFDPHSPIRVRILHCGDPVEIDEAWWSARLDHALNVRRDLFEKDTNGFRWINGESDGWPGLVLDRYDGTLVLKLYASAWRPRLAAITELIWDRLRPERIVLRLSRNLQSERSLLTSAATDEWSDGIVLRGTTLDKPVIFLESGLRFEADVLRGQKTGFFLDQRENRRAAARFAQGRRVLNAFSFSGGFSLYAARGGAESVTDLDISSHALAAAGRNFLLNDSLDSVSRCRHESLQADAFEWLENGPRGRFDLVILDPPSFARREADRPTAIRAYEKLATLGMGRLARGGILVAASCSAHVSAEEFFEAVGRSATRSNRRFVEVARSGHAPDHPATFKEANYLKAVFLKCP